MFNYYGHVIQSDYSNLVYVCELSIIAILKATLVSEPACLDKLSHFLKDGEKVSSKPIRDLCNL